MSASLTSFSYFCTLIFYKMPNCPFVMFDVILALAPMAAYLELILRIYLAKSASNFKRNSSALFLVSNSLRIIYFYGVRFALYLLWQAISTVVVHLILCFQSYYYAKNDESKTESNQNEGNSNKKPMFSFHPFQANSFLGFMIIFILFIGLAIGVIAFLSKFISFNIVINSIGLISNLMDSFVTAPHFITIVFYQDVKYATIFLVLQWNAGTILKLFLFFFRPTPWPFKIGAIVQAIFTFSIAIQYFRLTYLASRKNFDKNDKENSLTKDNPSSDEENSNSNEKPFFPKIEDSNIKNKKEEDNFSEMSSASGDEIEEKTN